MVMWGVLLVFWINNIDLRVSLSRFVEIHVCDDFLFSRSQCLNRPGVICCVSLEAGIGWLSVERLDDRGVLIAYRYARVSNVSLVYRLYFRE